MAAPCTVFASAFTFLALVTAGYCCPPQSPSPGDPVTTPGTVVVYGAEIPPTLHIQDKPQLAKRSVPSSPVTISPENFFHDVDISGDEVMDACDWLNSPYATRIHDYVNMLADLDLNGDDALSMDEFQPIKIVADNM